MLRPATLPFQILVAADIQNELNIYELDKSKFSKQNDSYVNVCLWLFGVYQTQY